MHNTVMMHCNLRVVNSTEYIYNKHPIIIKKWNERVVFVKISISVLTCRVLWIN